MAINNKAKMASKAHKNLTRVERASERAGQNVICQMHSPFTPKESQSSVSAGGEGQRAGVRAAAIKVENEINIRIASIKLSELASQIL